MQATAGRSLDRSTVTQRLKGLDSGRWSTRAETAQRPPWRGRRARSSPGRSSSSFGINSEHLLRGRRGLQLAGRSDRACPQRFKTARPLSQTAVVLGRPLGFGVSPGRGPPTELLTIHSGPSSPGARGAAFGRETRALEVEVAYFRRGRLARRRSRESRHEVSRRLTDALAGGAAVACRPSTPCE